MSLLVFYFIKNMKNWADDCEIVTNSNFGTSPMARPKNDPPLICRSKWNIFGEQSTRTRNRCWLDFSMLNKQKQQWKHYGSVLFDGRSVSKPHTPFITLETINYFTAKYQMSMDILGDARSSLAWASETQTIIKYHCIMHREVEERRKLTASLTVI